MREGTQIMLCSSHSFHTTVFEFFNSSPSKLFLQIAFTCSDKFYSAAIFLKETCPLCSLAWGSPPLGIPSMMLSRSLSSLLCLVQWLFNKCQYHLSAFLNVSMPLFSVVKSRVQNKNKIIILNLIRCTNVRNRIRQFYEDPSCRLLTQLF